MEIPKQLQKEITDYCKLNNIKDVDKFIIKTLTSGFTIVKYGVQPQGVVKEIGLKEEITPDESNDGVVTPIIPKKTNKIQVKDDLYGEG